MAKKKRATKKKPSKLSVETLVHEDASRYNIPTAELESVMEQEDKSPIRVAFVTTIGMFDRYLPAFLSVIYGNELPKDAIQCVEAGKSDPGSDDADRG